MSMGSLAVIEAWLTAVNRGDSSRVAELSAEDVEIAGPKGTARGRQVLAGWMARAGFSAEPLRWFCGTDGRAVVEQQARWVDPATKAELGRANVASQFAVQDGAVAYYQRHDSLDQALADAGLTRDSEVTHRTDTSG
jgi:SnoaL-like domain